MEVLAYDLEWLFYRTGLQGKRTYTGKDYEVWEVSEPVFRYMCSMSEEEFQAVCPNGWWRSAEGSIMGTPTIKYVINGHEIDAWDGYKRFGSRKYDSLTQYFCDELGASTERNVCALAVHLAKSNDMTLAELFEKYEG